MLWERPIIWAVAIGVLLGLAGVYYYYSTHSSTPEPVAPAPQVHLPPAPPEPAVHNPVPAAPPPAAQPLPALNDSDPAIHDALSAVPGAAAVEKFLIPQSVIRHIVVTVDNLPRKKVALEVRPVKPTAGQFATVSSGDSLTLSPQNYGRYAPFVELVKSTDVKQLAGVYFRFYPLFQQSYEDLGYPGQYFNDRVIEVIDDLLAAPDVKGPVALVQPNVTYQYADPKLEASSAGQKTLMRMGPENEAAIKDKLRALRAELATRKK
jgi:hypothetical protein